MDKKPHYFNPVKVNDIFIDITAFPRYSGNEKAVREYIIARVEEYNKQYAQNQVRIIYYNKDVEKPGERNIILRREGRGAKANKPAVILQAHLDMVCLPSRNIFPLELNKYTDEQGVEMLKAGGFSVNNGTTLGADDGIGLAIALAVITDPKLETGPVECLFTVQEEVDMGGARELDISFLAGNNLINLDAEEYNIITCGSAGGLHAKYEWQPAAEKIPAGYKTLFLEIDGLSGGHSGVNIDEGRANAIKLMARLLDYIRRVKKKDFNLVRFGTTNNRYNVIPNNSQAAVSCTAADSGEILESARQMLAVYKEEYGYTDPGFGWHAEEIGNPHYMLDAEHSCRLLDLLQQLPHGPLKMIGSNSHIVESSINLAIVDADYRKITLECSNRSSVDNSMETIRTLHCTLAGMYGINRVVYLDAQDQENDIQTDHLKEQNAILVFSSRYPAWQPDTDSGLLLAARDVYKEIYGENNFSIAVVHAGLECGWIMSKFTEAGRKMECIAIGPTIHTPHSWNERLEINSVQSFYDSLIKILYKVQE